MPRFKTLLRQAEEQCKKQFDALDMQLRGDIIVKFFASGMEYRLSHSHLEFERTFSICSDVAYFLYGYLQGKEADADMIKVIEEECRNLSNSDSYKSSDLVHFFTEGIFYEESILEPNKLQTSLD